MSGFRNDALGFPEDTEGVNHGSRAPEGFSWRETAIGRILVCSALEQVARHIFTTRRLRFLHGSADDDYASVASYFDVRPDDVVRVRQVHGRTVLAADEKWPAVDASADAIVTANPSFVASVRVADCVPILIADRHGRAVAAVHAGWRGTAARVASATIQALTTRGVAPSDLVVAIGPSIGPCCYQVDAVVHETCLKEGKDAAAWFTEDGPDHWRLDLWQANRLQLEGAGVPATAISIARWCTADNLGDFYSHRREREAAGRMVAAIQNLNRSSNALRAPDGADDDDAGVEPVSRST